MSTRDEAISHFARKDLAAYSIAVQKDYVPNWHHIEIAKKLEAVERGEIKRLIIEMPPQHGKSELSSIKFPSYALGRNPRRKIITVSYAAEVAARFGREVRNIFSLPAYQSIFPGVQLREDSKAANRFNTSEGGFYIAAGRDGSVTSFGADIMILDDMFKNSEEADSEVIRSKVWELYSSTLRTRLHQDSAIIMLMTRWHEDDLIGKVLDLAKRGGDQWERITYPALATKDEEYRKEGEALWPAKFGQEYLELTKRNTETRHWHCLYQQQPTRAEGQVFHPEWFRYYDQMPGDMLIAICVDPAFKKKATSDYSVVMTCGMREGKTYILEYSHKRQSPAELIDEIIRQNKKWKPLRVGIEAYAAQSVLGFYYEQKCAEMGVTASYQEILQKGDKIHKINRLEPKIREGKVFWKPFMTDFENELLTFPTGKHDDIIDCLQMFDELKISTYDVKPDESFDTSGFVTKYNAYGEPVYS